MSKASESLNVDKTSSSLHIIGGIECYPLNSRYPDLHVEGGMRVNDKLCVGTNVNTRNLVANIINTDHIQC
jgi:hypothetical protein